MKYRKKPVVIEAVQYDGTFPLDFLAGDETVYKADDGLNIDTLEGTMHVSLGDWIIRGVKGELYPCKPDIFDASYEAANSPGLQQASRAMLDALEGLEAWDDDLGSRSVSEAVWTARDSLRAALSGSQKEPT